MTLSPKDDAALTIPDHLRLLPPTPGHNARLDALVGEIDACYDNVMRQISKTTDGMVQAGRLLIEAKELVPHGRFKEWIQNHLKVPYRTAARWMQVAKREEKRSSIIQHLSDAGHLPEADVVDVLDGPAEEKKCHVALIPQMRQKLRRRSP